MPKKKPGTKKTKKNIVKKSIAKKRIAFELPLPSFSLKRFIERVIKEDDFLELAMENPIATFKESGVNLDEKNFGPSDFAGFFAALNNVKEMADKDKIKDLTFEGVFADGYLIEDGICADVYREKGYFKEWDNRDAVLEQSVFTTKNKEFNTNKEFFINRELLANQDRDRLANLDRDRLVNLDRDRLVNLVRDRLANLDKDRLANLDKDRFANLDRDRFANLDRDRFAQMDSVSPMEDYLRGPLISTSDLKVLSARLNDFVKYKDFIKKNK